MPQKVYLNPQQNMATITCPQCTKAQIADISKYRNIHRPIKVRCGCGHYFPIILEERKFYRKEADLKGIYTCLDNRHSGRLVVETLSFSGVGFRCFSPPPLHTDEILQLSFTLNNDQQTLMEEDVIVRWIEGLKVGTEFCERKDVDRVLSVYLMPS